MDKQRAYIEFINEFPLGIYRTTVEGKLLFCNPAFVTMFCFESSQELVDFQEINIFKNKKDRGVLLQKLLETGWVANESLWLVTRTGDELCCDITAAVSIDEDGIPIHIDGIIRQKSNPIDNCTLSQSENEIPPMPDDSPSIEDLLVELTNSLAEHKDDQLGEKFEGVLEMAGGVAHSVSQPLTVINNTLLEILSDLSKEDRNVKKLLIIRDQVRLLNDIIKKIKNIKEYKSMDYVAGLKIVDIDSAS
ncbi:MAG: hypothetical protein HKM93_00250 [Desulfobacteraceae bacterium]|nr:hypothetical protein [Desulfobacteraceae bacterium]